MFNLLGGWTIIVSRKRAALKVCLGLFLLTFLTCHLCLLRVVVMDHGSIAETDSPSQLLCVQGHFYQMCVEAGLA